MQSGRMQSWRDVDMGSKCPHALWKRPDILVKDVSKKGKKRYVGGYTHILAHSSDYVRTSRIRVEIRRLGDC